MCYLAFAYLIRVCLERAPKKSRSGNEYFYFCLTAAGVEESTRKSISFASRVGRGLLLLHRWCSVVPRMLVLGSWAIFLYGKVRASVRKSPASQDP